MTRTEISQQKIVGILKDFFVSIISDDWIKLTNMLSTHIIWRKKSDGRWRWSFSYEDAGNYI